MFRYAYNSLVYYGESFPISAKRVAKYGYDAIEIYGEPEEYDPAEVRKICEDLGITVSSICALYTEKRDLASPDEKWRKKAIDYMKRLSDLASEVACPVIIVAPTAVMKTKPWKDPVEERGWAVESIRAGGEYAYSLGVSITIEAWNRYETYFLNRIEQCLDLMREVDLPNAGIMGDTFHMNIEEESIEGAFRQAGKDLNHVHLADSNRAAPGKGHIDFLPIFQALKDIDYQGHLSFELLPAISDPLGTLKRGGGREFFDDYTKQSIAHCKAVEKNLQ
jgi:sugar phosphate isomerase/epimerase